MKWQAQLIIGVAIGVAVAGAVVYGVIELTDYMMEFLP